MRLGSAVTRSSTGGIGPSGPMSKGPVATRVATNIGYVLSLPVDNEEIRLTYLAGLLWVIETYKLKPKLGRRDEHGP